MVELLDVALDWVQIIGTVIAIITAVVTAAMAGWNRFKSVLADKQNSIKEIATAAIIEVEQLLEASKEALKDAGLDTGEYKLTSVTATIQTACADKNISYDEEYWKTFIESQVAVLNATKNMNVEETL